MNVYEVKLKLYCLRDILLENIQCSICSLIDKGFLEDMELSKFHKENKFKNYCFDGLYPLCEEGIYKKGGIYVLTLRTTVLELADYFANKLVNEYDENFKGLTSEIKILPKKHIKRIYTLTPAVLKSENGYWKNDMHFDDFERRLKDNLIKKYNCISGIKADEGFDLYTSIEFKNRIPIAVKYKNIKLLGDKISLEIADDDMSQELAYMSLGTGILEANARGFGFVNYRWL